MFASLRAGGLAAAFVLLSATVGAGPSQAWDLPAQASASSLSTPPIAAPARTFGEPEPGQRVLPVQIEAPAVPEAAVPAAPAPVVEPLPPVAQDAPEAPVPPQHATLAALVAQNLSSQTPDRERECLAGAIYFEAKGEPLSGQVAVGQVIANRAKSGRFPRSWCGVVFQRSQFSFVRGGGLPPIPRGSAHWKTAVAVAHIVANELAEAVAPKALFFHARRVSPGWKLSRVGTVGNHVFYR